MRHSVCLLFAAVVSAASCFAQATAPAAAAVQPPTNQHAVLTVQGRGSQVYGCRLVGTTFQWVFEAPVARLFDADGVEVGTHGDGPTWVYQDSSSIQGAPVAKSAAPVAGAVPWLLVKAVNPLRTGLLTTVEYITRTNTEGGVAPATGCDAAHEGTLLRVPYSATYTFFSSAK